MFRHQGSSRTSKHNLRLAILLSSVAGIVNITGVLAVNTLTTNVTGHFAFFAEEMTKHNFQAAIVFLIYTLFFLAGAFTSAFLAELISKKHQELSHLPAIAVEIAILVSIALCSMHPKFYLFDKKWIAFALLFAMGIQNALVTKISKSTVRTTHLTGLFTDLGIELSQLFFYKKTEEQATLKTVIYLRLSIISFFFLGCFMGGYIYGYLNLKTLFVAAGILIFSLYYDYFRMNFIAIKRKKIHF